MSMDSLTSTPEKTVELGQTQAEGIASSSENVNTAPSKSEATDDEIPADNCVLCFDDAQLPYMIDFDHGLLDELITIGLINREKFEPFTASGINHNNTTEARVSLMHDIINASTAQREQFLSALDKTQQSHVTKFIRHNKQRPSDTDDDWPALDGFWIISEHFQKLINLIDIECGLLDEVISAGILSEGQMAAVSTKSSQDENNVRALLHIIVRKSIADYKKFINCLVKTKQFRVVSMLDPSTAAAHPILGEDLRAKLYANYSTLVELIDSQHGGLLRELQAADCLTYKQRIFIESAPNELVSTRRLLDIIARGSQSDYDNFLTCLDNTGQSHVANILSTDTAVSRITARGPAVDSYQSYIVKEFKRLLMNSSERDRLHLLSSALGSGNELIYVKISTSITLFVASRSLSGLMQLRDMYSRKQLMTIVQEIFSKLLKNNQDLIIDELVWDKLDYNRCVLHLAEASGLSVYSRIHQYSLDITTEPPVCTAMIDSLPHELIEMLVMKAAGQLFVTMKMITTNVAMYTLVNLSAVCQYWWETLTCRRSNTRQLRRYFTKLCRPFRFNPQLVTSLQTGTGEVNSVETFDGKLYVVTKESNTINVYDVAGTSSYNLIERMNLPGLIKPFDLVLCRSTRRLFVSDYGVRCIWRVNLFPDSNVVDKNDLSLFITNLQYVPYKLSVQFQRLIVTPYDGDALYVYNINDDDVEKESQRVNLPDYMDAKHAVETSHGTFVVVHKSIMAEDTCSDHTGVSELSADGRVLRVYKGPTPFSRPVYITTVDGHFLISDRGTRQILQLNTDLELTQMLLADLPRNPRLQCYSVETGKLYINYENSDTVTAYNV